MLRRQDVVHFNKKKKTSLYKKEKRRVVMGCVCVCEVEKNIEIKKKGMRNKNILNLFQKYYFNSKKKFIRNK